MGAHLTSSQFMRNSKYIIFGNEDIEVPVVFSPLLTHATLAKGIATGMTVVSAGFCERNEDGDYYVWGESISLKKGSRPEDAEILNNSLSYDC